jgi:hypothetical protein
MNKQTVGTTGTYLVAAELSRRRYVAVVTIGNTKAIDILASNPNTGKAVSVQVKTSQGKNKTKGRDYWPLSKKDERRRDKDLFYVFVVLTEPPVYYVVRSASMAKQIHSEEQKRIRRGLKPSDTRYWIADEADKKYLNNWKSLGLGAVAETSENA